MTGVSLQEPVACAAGPCVVLRRRWGAFCTPNAMTDKPSEMGGILREQCQRSQDPEAYDPHCPHMLRRNSLAERSQGECLLSECVLPCVPSSEISQTKEILQARVRAVLADSGS